MRIAALLLALFTILVGIVGLVSPDSVTTVRRLYFATPVGLYTAGAVRVAMGLVLILCAPISRAPGPCGRWEPSCACKDTEAERPARMRSRS